MPQISSLAKETAIHALTAAAISVVTVKFVGRYISYIPQSPLGTTALYSGAIGASNLITFRLSDATLNRCPFFRNHFFIKYALEYAIISAANGALYQLSLTYQQYMQLEPIELLLHMTLAASAFRVIVVADAIFNKNALSYVIPERFAKYVPGYLLKPQLTPA